MSYRKEANLELWGIRLLKKWFKICMQLTAPTRIPFSLLQMELNKLRLQLKSRYIMKPCQRRELSHLFNSLDALINPRLTVKELWQRNQMLSLGLFITRAPFFNGKKVTKRTSRRSNQNSRILIKLKCHSYSFSIRVNLDLKALSLVPTIIRGS